MCEHLSRWKAQQRGSAVYQRVQRACFSLWQARDSSRQAVGTACLSCGCCSGSNERHGRHGQASGHCLALDLGVMELYCSCCRDFIYDSEFYEALLGAAVVADKGLSGALNSDRPLPRGLEVLRASTEQESSRRSSGDDAGPAADAALLSSARKAGGIDGRPAGLRGLVNLGNTCFMSTVLQALLHAPLLRSYYLGGGHPNATCYRANAKSCISCELEKIFSAAYSGDRVPFCPTNFLTAWWLQSDALVGYQQQDAHEFYIFLLSGLESSRVVATATPSATSPAPSLKQEVTQGREAPGVSSHPSEGLVGKALAASEHLLAAVKQESWAPADRQPSPAPREPSDAESDDGIVDRTFGGLLRSDVSCSACGYTSTVYEPFLDISLDIKPLAGPTPPLPKLSSPQPSPRVGVSKNGKKLVGAAAAASAKAAAKAAKKALAAANAVGAAPVAPGALTALPGEGLNGGLAVTANAVPSATLPSRETSRDDLMAEGGRSHILEASGLVTHSTDGNSSVGAGSSIWPAPEVGGDETLSSPLQHSTAQLQAGGASASLPEIGAKRPAPKPGRLIVKRLKTTRCGDCHTCRNKHLKKACLRNAQLKRQVEETDPCQAALMVPMQSAEGGLSPSASAIFALPTPLSEVARVSAVNDPASPSELTATTLVNLDIPSEDVRSGGLASVATADRGGSAACLLNGSVTLHAAPNPGTGMGAEAMRSSPDPADAQLQSSPLPPSSGKTSGKKAKTKTPIRGPACQTAACPGVTLDSLCLQGCLRRYVRPEKLGAKWLCDGCKERQGVKQVSIRRLPQVLCLHLKRFQHPGTHGMGRKLTTPVTFPPILDMAPFVSSAVLTKRFLMRTGSLEGHAERGANRALYELYAIVCHKGNLQGGHYIAHVKCEERWFCCDDARVTEVLEETALAAQAYMLFYRTLS